MTNWKAVWKEFDKHPMTSDLGKDSKSLICKLARKYNGFPVRR